MHFVCGGRIALENTIKIGGICPHKECDKQKERVIFTNMQLQDHWNLHHKTKENMTAGQYVAKQEGRLLTFRYCQAYNIGKKGYTQHKQLCIERDMTSKRDVATSAANKKMGMEGKEKDKGGRKLVGFEKGNTSNKKEEGCIKK